MQQYLLNDKFCFLLAAYIDPGVGSMFLQVFLSFLLGAIFFFRKLIANAFIFVKQKLFRSK